MEIKIEGNRVKLDNYKVKNIWLVPEWEIITTEDTRPILDVNGMPILNDNGEPIILSSFQKVSRVLLKPQEANSNALQVGAAEKMDARKSSRNGRKMGKGNKEKEITQEGKEEKEIK